MRQIFIVCASGQEASEHFEDTIKRKRSLSEVSKFLSESEVNSLNNLYHGSDFAVWGATPGLGNRSTWAKMESGDYLVFYQRGRFTLLGEVAAKLKNKELARYFWGLNPAGETWENIYFIINEEPISVPIEKFNQYLGYKSNFIPQGFASVESGRLAEFENSYGDFYSLMTRLNGGHDEDIVKINNELSVHKVEIIEEAKEKEPTEHDEMQWRLIKLGKAAGNDVWVPRNNQNKIYKGSSFREFVLKEFEPGLDIPRAVEDIDCVWRYGFQIKSAFEIEHSTAIYSGILRLSDLKSVAPNSIYPLIIVGPREVKSRVSEQMKRPTFSNPYLKLKEAEKFLSYEKIRDLDDRYSDTSYVLTTEMILDTAEIINGNNL